MGAARKLREQVKPVELTPLKTPEKDKNKPIKSFITLILILTVLITGLSVYFTNNEDQKENLEEFIERVKEKKPEKPERFIIGKVPDELALNISDVANQSIKGFYFSIISEKITHIENKHGVKKEKSKSQLAVQLSDYKEMIKTLYVPDKIDKANDAKNGAKQLRFCRIDEKEYIVFVQLSNKKNFLDVNTFYIKKAANNRNH
jgi:hypothetical protein